MNPVPCKRGLNVGFEVFEKSLNCIKVFILSTELLIIRFLQRYTVQFFVTEMLSLSSD